MTLRIHAPNPIRVGETANVLVTSDNPGVVSLTYGAGLTGPATATIEGTREYRLDGRGGDYLARAGAEGAGREDVTWLFEIDTSRIKNTSTTIAPNTDYEPLIGSFRQDLINRANWFLFCWRNPNGMNVGMMDSLDSASPPFHFINGTPTVWTINEKRKYALTKASGGSVKLYTASRATATTATRNSVGSIGGSEVLALNAGPLVQCSKILRVVSDAELDAWFADGTIPATDREFVFSGGHEIDPAAPVIWDTSGNVTPLDLTATQITNWQAPAMSADYTDTVPVVPYAIIPVTAIATTDTTIDGTRPRQGVPARASYSERTEVADQCVVTVNDPVGAVGPAITARVKR
jgi:hypothetical protein